MTSPNRILTTHTGSLPRPETLVSVLRARNQGETIDEPELEREVRHAVGEVVRRQLATGLDVVNDGETGKLSYSTYVKTRLTGFEIVEDAAEPVATDLLAFPAYAARLYGAPPPRRRPRSVCVDPVGYRGHAELERDLANLRDALGPAATAGAFLSAASPGVISLFFPNRHYPSHEAYIWAIADAMRTEYEAVHRAGFVLQIDCPDLALGRHFGFSGLSPEEFRAVAEIHIAALNHATAAIPPDRMRLHLCWGNYEGPHHHDAPLREVVDTVLRARPAGLSIEAANPRHGHEWRVWEEVPLPEHKVLIPGVIDSTTNFVEHPELVAERIVRFAGIVGHERVIAGTDCGLATVAGSTVLDPDIAWAKLGSLVEGARLASQELWP